MEQQQHPVRTTGVAAAPAEPQPAPLDAPTPSDPSVPEAALVPTAAAPAEPQPVPLDAPTPSDPSVPEAALVPTAEAPVAAPAEAQATLLVVTPESLALAPAPAPAETQATPAPTLDTPEPSDPSVSEDARGLAPAPAPAAAPASVGAASVRDREPKVAFHDDAESAADGAQNAQLPKKKVNRDELTNTQLNCFKKVFRFFDKDNNGSIDINEIYSQALTLGLDLTVDQIQEAIQAMTDNNELNFNGFLEILTCTDRYLKTLRNDWASPKEAVMFAVLSKYLHQSQEESNDEDAAVSKELECYYATKAKTLQPHVIADYAAGNRLIGLSEKQLQRGLREMVRAKNDEEKSPYAHYSKLQLWSDCTQGKLRKRKTKPGVLTTMQFPLPKSKLLQKNRRGGAAGDDVAKVNSAWNHGGKYRARKIQLPIIPNSGSTAIQRTAGPQQFLLYQSKVNLLTQEHNEARNQDRRQCAEQHWGRLRPGDIPEKPHRDRFAKAFVAYLA